MKATVAVSMSFGILLAMTTTGVAQGGARPLLTPEEEEILRHGGPYASEVTGSIPMGQRRLAIEPGQPTAAESSLDRKLRTGTSGAGRR
jgi:hypothetical protein